MIDVLIFNSFSSSNFTTIPTYSTSIYAGLNTDGLKTYLNFSIILYSIFLFSYFLCFVKLFLLLFKTPFVSLGIISDDNNNKYSIQRHKMNILKVFISISLSMILINMLMVFGSSLVIKNNSHYDFVFQLMFIFSILMISLINFWGVINAKSKV